MKKLKYNSWGLPQQIKVCFGNFLLQPDVKESKKTIQGGKVINFNSPSLPNDEIYHTLILTKNFTVTSVRQILQE